MVQRRRKTAVEEIKVMCVCEVVSLYVCTSMYIHRYWRESRQFIGKCVYQCIIHIFNELEMKT